MCLITEHVRAKQKIAELELEIKQLREVPPVPIKPVVRKQVDGNYIYAILNAVKPAATHIYLSDNQYWLCSDTDIETFLEMDDTNKMGFVSEERDCDDFSYRLMGQLSTPEWSGIAFGIVWTNLHALCCFIDDAGKFWFVEPQNDKLQDKLEDWQGNEILFILF